MPSVPRNPAKALFKSLAGIGLTQASIKAVLPSWWDDSLAEDPTGIAELKVLLARRLSVDPSTLFDETKSIEFMPVVRRYKGGREDLMDKLCASTAIAGSLGRTALKFLGPQRNIPADPLALRARILEKGAPWVSLENLIDICWESGIPVLHATLPANLSKFDALVMTEEGRYSIVLCRNEGSVAWLTFHLAHEIGHIACGHIAPDAMLVDEKIEDEARSTHQQEVEANDYALKLLGAQGVDLPRIDRRIPVSRIAAAARNLGKDHKVLPGHLILKAGKRDNNFPLARQALAFVDGQVDGRTVINARAVQHMSAAGWTDEAEEFLQKFMRAPKV